MSSSRRSGAWQWRSRALPCGSGVGSKGVQKGGQDGDRLSAFLTHRFTRHASQERYWCPTVLLGGVGPELWAPAHVLLGGVGKDWKDLGKFFHNDEVRENQGPQLNQAGLESHRKMSDYNFRSFQHIERPVLIQQIHTSFFHINLLEKQA